MVDSKEISANWFDLAMVIWGMAAVTSWGKVANSTTFHYIAEYYIEETEKKRMDQQAYLFVVATTSGADLIGKLVLFLLLLLCRLLSILGLRGSFLWSDISCRWRRLGLYQMGTLCGCVSFCI